MDLTLREMRRPIVVAQHRSLAAEKRCFRQAAIELGVWGSTISRGIRDLEEETGVAHSSAILAE